MVKMNIQYEGSLRCRLIHEPSGSQIVTDAPVDNHGKGEAFSPTDLFAVSLGSCILTVMGIAAQKSQILIEGARATVVKEMVTTPIRRIGKIQIKVLLPHSISMEHRAFLERVAHACPVHQSIHPDVVLDITFDYSV